MKKNKGGVDISRELWITLLNLSKENKVNRLLSVEYVCTEEIKRTENEILYRHCFQDIKSKKLFCVKYILFKDAEGKADVAVNTPYTDKLYEI